MPIVGSPLPLAGEGRGRGQAVAGLREFQSPQQPVVAIRAASCWQAPALSPDPSPINGRGELIGAAAIAVNPYCATPPPPH
ncbi:hypothetical protein CBM2589_B220042 [Cupriavidus taiwanensis]|uniref:Uncharacterized protein n=1 Tax=Cupriavidus taiwanensis TaxID=164546 RepID=A0A375BNM6_9BURK|nr:hypothetical protein CBM2589_B220042 [Cupriavidus taiwanensis]